MPLFRAGSLLCNYYNADFDGLVDQAQTTMDEKQRLEIYHRINRLWIDDAAGGAALPAARPVRGEQAAQLEGA